MNAETKKCCTRCKREKPLIDFVKDKRTPSGRGSACRACVKIAKDSPLYKRELIRQAKARAKRRDTDFSYYRRQKQASGRMFTRRNCASRVSASGHYKPWTTEQNAILLDAGLSAAQAAAIVGRTIVAVLHQRRKLQKRLMLDHPIGTPTARRYPKQDTWIKTPVINPAADISPKMLERILKT